MKNVYKKGRRKEYQIVYDERAKGNIAFRSAGSHSAFDVVSIDFKNRIITLIQSKRTMSETMKFTDEKLKEKIEKENKYLEGFYEIIFEVR